MCRFDTLCLMKTAEQWREELAGETSLESIRQIQNDAIMFALRTIVESYRECRANGLDESAAFKVAIDEWSKVQ